MIGLNLVGSPARVYTRNMGACVQGSGHARCLWRIAPAGQPGHPFGLRTDLVRLLPAGVVCLTVLKQH
jgi:hypothetical protein